MFYNFVALLCFQRGAKTPHGLALAYSFRGNAPAVTKSESAV